MKKGLRDTMWVTAADGGARLIGFVVTAFLARTLAPESFGVMSIGLAVVGYLSQVSGAGLQVVETRNVASGIPFSSERLGAVLMLRMSISVLLIALMILAVAFGSFDPETADALFLSALILIPLALSIDWYFQGGERFGVLSIARLVNAAVYGAVILLLVRVPDDFRTAILGVGAGALAGILVLFVVLLRGGGEIRLSIDPGLWNDLLRRSLPVGAALLISQSAVNLGPIVLGVAENAAEAGLFAAAMRVVIAMLILDRVLNNLFLPVLARIRTTRPAEFAATVKLVFKGVNVVSLPAAVGMFLLSPQICHFLFGPGYEQTAMHLRFLLPYFVLTLLNSVATCALMAAGEERSFSRYQMIGSTVLIAAVLLVTALAGPLGAGVGISIGELVTLLLLLRILRNRGEVNLTATAFRFAASVGCTAVLIYFAMEIDPGILIPVAIVGLITSMLVTRALSLQDARLLWGRFI